MTTNIVFPAILTSIKSRADNSWALTFSTRELKGKEASEMIDMLMLEGYLAFVQSASPEDAHITVPEIKPDAGMDNKSPSQRLRSVLYVLWEQGGSQGTFESFYLSKMEQIIDTVKSKLE